MDAARHLGPTPLQYEPRNPNFEQRVRESFARQRFMDHCSIVLSTVDPGFVEMRVSRREELTQQHGFLHGGLVGTVADNSCGYAAFSLLGVNDSIVTVEYKINLLSPAKGDELIARARVIRSGGSLLVSQSDLSMRTGETEKPCATALCTLMVLKNTPDEPQS